MTLVADPVAPAPIAPAASQPAAPVAPAAAPAAPAAPAVADPYASLAMPEGAKLPTQHLTSIRTFAAEHKLDPGVAKAVLEHEAGLVAGLEQAQEQEWTALKDSWVATLQADKDLGGEHLARTTARRDAVLSRFAPPGMADRLKATGFLNEPDFVRLLNAVGAAIEEAPSVPSGQPVPSNVPLTPRQQWEKTYPNSPYPGRD